MLVCTKAMTHDHAAKMQDAPADAVDNAEVAEEENGDGINYNSALREAVD